jgi:hypothetical protein
MRRGASREEWRSCGGNALQVEMPPNGNVAPPGPYMLFVNKRASAGLVPSVSRQLFLRP